MFAISVWICHLNRHLINEKLMFRHCIVSMYKSIYIIGIYIDYIQKFVICRAISSEPCILLKSDRSTVVTCWLLILNLKMLATCEPNSKKKFAKWRHILFHNIFSLAQLSVDVFLFCFFISLRIYLYMPWYDLNWSREQFILAGMNESILKQQNVVK